LVQVVALDPGGSWGRLLSVVVANYNKAPFIGQTLASLAGQTMVREIIVVDDASTDDSIAVIRQAAERDSRIRVVELLENKGQSHAENQGLARASGKYVVFLDSDDLLKPDCCERRVQTAEAHPDADGWVFPMNTFDGDPERPTSAWIPRQTDHLRRVLAHCLDWQLTQVTWRRDFLLRIGGFDESFVRLTDVSLHTRALLAGARLMCFPDFPPDVLYRITPDRYSWSARSLADRHVAGSIHYIDTYRTAVPRQLERLLAGTALAALHRIIHFWRSGRLPKQDLERLAGLLIASCRHAGQRMILQNYLRLNVLSPVHVRGLTWATRRLLRLPEPSRNQL
jgi:glycosyltransferase involved in cell wall biosynthesis